MKLKNKINKCIRLDVHSPEHGRAIQLRLFELGQQWTSGQTVEYPKATCLFADSSGYLSYSTMPRYQGSKLYETVTLDDLYDPKYTRPTYLSVVLNDRITAEVTKDSIIIESHNVTIPIAKLEELEKVMKEGAKKSTLKDSPRHILIHSPEHCRVVQGRLFELGYRWPSSMGSNQFVHEDAAGLQIHWGYGDEMGIGWSNVPSWKDMKHHTVITLDDLYSDKFTKTKEVEVNLDGDHSAVVEEKTITVGCQTFPLSVIADLRAAHNKIIAE